MTTEFKSVSPRKTKIGEKKSAGRKTRLLPVSREVEEYPPREMIYVYAGKSSIKIKSNENSKE